MKTGTDNNDFRYMRCITVLAALLAAFAVMTVLNLIIGSVEIPIGGVVTALFGGDTDALYYDIIWKLRLPRTAADIILGGALALSGFLLQTFFNNPIAGPYVLGISSGAKLFVAILMVFGLSRGFAVSSAMLVAFAFFGSMASMGLVLMFSYKIRRMSALVISGIMIGYICSAVTDFVVTYADDESILNLHNWAQGSFSGMSWKNVWVMAVFVFAATACVFILSKPIGAYQLGEDYARSIGVDIKLFRAALVLLSSILCACVTAFAGPISFVGVAVPHIIRSLTKTAKPILIIPLCFLGGSVFCLICDLIARTVYAPVEMSISSVSSIFGAPVVIYVMMGRTVRD